MPKINNNIYVGVMSGTSLDGVDIALVKFTKNKANIIGSNFYPYKNKIRAKIKNVSNNNINSLNTELGILFADCINSSLKQFNLTAKQISGIGLHGQTVDHQPHAPFPYSLQIGDPNFVSFKTGIATVADFRTKDICAGGQGAPLAPAFHAKIFRNPNKNIIVLNIGGIANITHIPADKNLDVIGWDTGPGNCLSDDWIEHVSSKKYDKNGAWAKSGTVNENLLSTILQDAYFQKLPPKSTGRDYFNLKWLNNFKIDKIKPEDMQATLVELTVQTISNAIKNYPTDEVFICGGGIHNIYLKQQLNTNLNPISIKSTIDKDIDPDMLEAIAFAWLAKRTMNNKTGNLPAVTGAKKKVVLGAVYGV